MTFQLGGALLDGCVLAILSEEDTYGYVLTQNLMKATNISESTLYPVLRRLQKEKCLEIYDKPYQGRNRRYYHMTSEGRERLKTTRREWGIYKENIDSIIEGGACNE